MIRRSKSRSRTWLFSVLFLALYLLGWSIIIYNMNDGYRAYKRLQAKRLQLEDERQRLAERLEETRQKAVMRQADTPFFVEMVARENLKMAKEGEVIIRTVEHEGQQTQD